MIKRTNLRRRSGGGNKSGGDRKSRRRAVVSPEPQSCYLYNPKGPCTDIVYTLAQQDLHRGYFVRGTASDNIAFHELYYDFAGCGSNP